MLGFEVFSGEERQAINEIFDKNGGILFAHGFDAMCNGVYLVREFEAAVGKKFGVKHSLAVASCSATLLDSPAFTSVTTAEVVIQSGADLVIGDIDESFDMDSDAFGAAITDRTKLVMPVRMIGAQADMDRIPASAAEHGGIGKGFSYRMTELQDAIGIVRLGKLDMIIKTQRANKAKLRALLDDGGFPLRYRKILVEGELGDALILCPESRGQPQAFLAGMQRQREELGAKNIPDAIRWRFAKQWSHMFEEYGWRCDSCTIQ